ncbi:MAG: Cof-type HAD-IIB family hydrolase [Mycobacterium leprae]
MTYRLIAMDLDGTLLNSQMTISPRTREALAAARARGVHTVVVTGRSPHSALYWSRMVGGGPVICCTGAAVLDEEGRAVLTRPIPPAPLLRLLEICQESGLLVECYTESAIILDRYWLHVWGYIRWVKGGLGFWRSVQSWRRFARVNHIRRVPSLLRLYRQGKGAPVLKLMVLGRDPALSQVRVRLAREMPGLEVTSSGVDNLEVTAAGVTKGITLELLAGRMQIPRQAIVAVGDSENDLSMLAYAGLGVAMGNAPESVKAAADLVTATCDEDGVAQLVEEQILR